MRLADHVAGWALGVVFLGAAYVLAGIIGWPQLFAIAIATPLTLVTMVAAQTLMADRPAAAMWAMMLGLAPILVVGTVIALRPATVRPELPGLQEITYPLFGGFVFGRIAGIFTGVARRATPVLFFAPLVWMLGVALTIGSLVAVPPGLAVLAIFGLLGSAAFFARGRRKWRAYDRLGSAGQDARHLGEERVELEGGEIVRAPRAAGLPVGPVVIEPNARVLDGAYREGRSIRGRIVEGTREELRTTAEDLAFRYMSASIAWAILSCTPMATALVVR